MTNGEHLDSLAREIQLRILEDRHLCEMYGIDYANPQYLQVREVSYRLISRGAETLGDIYTEDLLRRYRGLK